MSAEVIIYTAAYCPYCRMAKDLLDAKGFKNYHEIDASAPDVRADLLEKTGGQRTVPQIFIDGKHIGGFDRLSELDEAGELDALLGPISENLED